MGSRGQCELGLRRSVCAVLAALAVMCALESAAQAAPQEVLSGKFLALALDGDILYWAELSDGGPNLIRRSSLGSFSPEIAATYPRSQFIRSLAAGAGRFAARTEAFRHRERGDPTSRDSIFVSEPNSATMRRVISGTYAFTSMHPCGTLPYLVGVEPDGRVLYAVNSAPHRKWRCSSRRVRTKLLSVEASTNPALPPGPQLIAKLKGYVWHFSRSGSTLAYSLGSKLKVQSGGGKPRTIATADAKDTSVVGDVNHLSQVIISRVADWAAYDNNRVSTSILPGIAPGAQATKLANRYWYQFCGSNLLRYRVGKVSTIELLANPFIVAAKPPRVILPSSSVNIRNVTCNENWLAFTTIKYSAESVDHLFVEAL